MLLKGDDYKNLQGMISGITQVGKTQLNRNFSRYENIDKYMEKESDSTSETLQGRVANRNGNKKLANNEIPIVFIQHQTALADLAGTFLSGYPIFACSTKVRDLESGGRMLNMLTARDQQRMNWVGNLLYCFSDVLKFNICAAEVTWKSKKGTQVVTSIVAGVDKTGAAAPIIYEGMAIERLDPYNIIYDRLVEPHKVHTDGNMVGYVEIIDLITLRRRQSELNTTYIYRANLNKILGESEESPMAANYTRLYQVPQVHMLRTKQDPYDFSNFFGPELGNNNPQAGKALEWFKCYRRIIPSQYKIKMPNADNVHIFELIFVNGYLVYAEPKSLGHEYFPIILGQLSLGDENKKSFVEYILDNQDLATAFMTASMNSMRRAVADRALYDPSRIKKEHIESPNPTSKIPVSGNLFSKGLAEAYYQIPYVDNISGNMQNMMNLSIRLAELTNGVTSSTQGNFTPGNKTVTEYQDLQNNSRARLQLGAVVLGASFLNPIKEILKIGYLINATAESVTDRQTNTTTQIDPELLRTQAPEYRMADGLMPTTKIGNTEVLLQALAVMQNSPLMGVKYDTDAIILSVLSQQGFDNIDQYERSEEDQQKYMALMQGMNPTLPNKPSNPGA
jgi:hypothetical protein